MNDITAAIGLANSTSSRCCSPARVRTPGTTTRRWPTCPVWTTERAAAGTPSFWAYPLKVLDRPSFTRKLASAGILTTIVARRNDAHTCMAAAAEELPGVDSVYDRLVYIPAGWWLDDADRSRVVETIRSGW